MVLGVLGLWEWSPRYDRIFYSLGLAVIAITLGAVFRESRYRLGPRFSSSEL